MKIAILILLGYKYTISLTEYQKQGSTQYDDVYSDNSTTYPTDGYQDGYWYVLQTD